MYYIYVLLSEKSKRHYVGFTNDLKRRIKEHNSGTGGKYTRNNRPFKLVYFEAYLNKKDGQSAEKFYKTGYGREILNGKLKNYLLS